MKCGIMLHFICVLTVCKSTRLGFPECKGLCFFYLETGRNSMLSNALFSATYKFIFCRNLSYLIIESYVNLNIIFMQRCKSKAILQHRCKCDYLLTANSPPAFRSFRPHIPLRSLGSHRSQWSWQTNISFSALYKLVIYS